MRGSFARALQATPIAMAIAGCWYGIADVVTGDAGADRVAPGDAGESGQRDTGSRDTGRGPDTSTQDTGADVGVPAPRSCAPGGPGMTNCGPGGSGTESCCTSLAVPGGTFYRSYDAVTYADEGYPATVSAFRLDKYEITVGRFRQFVAAVVGGWLPAVGSGLHTHLNGGRGLSATGGGYEAGWDGTWPGLPTSATTWNTNLACDAKNPNWTASPGGNESKAVTCPTWFEAYAFCIWDGGFLPSETEWNDAAAGGGGGSGQRAYPWSSPSTSATIDCSHANYGGCPAGLPNDVGSESPAGDGIFGQTDLAGNAWEWNLDFAASPYVNPCHDCANLTVATTRVRRGGSFSSTAPYLLASERDRMDPTLRFGHLGARCARAP